MSTTSVSCHWPARTTPSPRRTAERRSGEALVELEPGQLPRVLVDEVGLREADEPVPYAQQLDDAQVLLALRHPTLVGGDHEHHDVHRAHAGEHVLDEPDVAGDVHEAHLLPGRQLREREYQ